MSSQLRLRGTFVIDSPRQAPEVCICSYELKFGGHVAIITQYPLTQVDREDVPKYVANTFNIHFMGETVHDFPGDCHSKFNQDLIVETCRSILHEHM